MYLSIIPFSHSIRTTPLTYVGGDIFSHGRVVPGSIVEIPLGKNMEYGLVIGETGNPGVDIEVRSISRIITERAVIEPYQLNMISLIAERYMLPIHRVLGFFLPRPITKRLEKYGYDILREQTGENSPTEEERIMTVFSHTTITPELLREYIRPRSVVICPDDFSLERYRRHFESATTLFLSSDMTDTQKAKSWIQIRNGEYMQIFGTRRILYYNLTHYEHIIYLEDAFGREYFHYPSRIRYLDVFLALEKSKTGSIELLSSIPLLSTLARCKHFVLKNHS